MSQEIWSFQVTIAAGTAITNPQRTSTTLPTRKVDELEIVVPPGPAGLMGFAVTMGGVNVIPIQSGTYVVTDDEKISWPLTNLPNTGAWQISGYNTGDFPHTIYLRWLVDIVERGAANSPLFNADFSLLSSG